MKPYEWAAGSVIGTEHQRISKNNQDAFLVQMVGDALVGVVADGCGSCPQSEVGAWLGVELTAQAIAAWLPQPIDANFCRQLRQQIIEGLPQALPPMKYYLFTLLGFVMLPEETFIFGCGDGVFVINETVTRWEFENNAPPYLIYPDESINLITQLATANIQSLLIGTDGLNYWLQQQSLATFWTDSRYFKNPDHVRRSLTIAKQKTAQLKDDTTLIVVRQTKN